MRERTVILLRAMTRYLCRGVLIALGVIVLTAGVIMIVTPGPAIVVIPLGLAMLGIRFKGAERRARHLWRRLRCRARRFKVSRLGRVALPRRTSFPAPNVEAKGMDAES